MKFQKLKNNPTLSYILSTDTAGRLIKVLNPNGGGGTDSTTGILSPYGAVIWDSLLVFHTTPYYYKINGVFYSAAA